MTFLSAWRLALLSAVAAFAVAWLVTINRRRTDVVRFTDVALLDVVAPDRSGWRRHLPAALWLVALTLLVVGFARPAREVETEREAAVVVLAMDVSLSMDAGDVQPTRLEAAQDAATQFVEGLPDAVDVGLVLFSGTITAYAPTDDRQALINTILKAELGESTAIGDALFRGLQMIDEASPDPAAGPESGSGGLPSRMVVLSDGETTVGRPDAEATAAAAEAGVVVDTISFGTPGGTITDELGVVRPVPVAPEPLRDIAEGTGGDFYEAESLDELSDAYQDIATGYTTDAEQREIGGWFTGAGLILLIAAGGLSLLWSQRLP